VPRWIQQFLSIQPLFRFHNFATLVVIVFSKSRLRLHKFRSVYYLRFEVLTAVSMKIAVFWVVATGSLVEVYQRFRGPCCLHHQGDRPTTRLHGATTQKTAIFICVLFICERGHSVFRFLLCR
jgi:hypothetical protein